MADAQTRPQAGGDADNPLLTPQEHEAIRTARELRAYSDNLTRCPRHPPQRIHRPLPPPPREGE